MGNKNIGIGNGIIGDGIVNCNGNTVESGRSVVSGMKVYCAGAKEGFVDMRCTALREMVELDKAEVTIVHCETTS